MTRTMTKEQIATTAKLLGYRLVNQYSVANLAALLAPDGNLLGIVAVEASKDNQHLLASQAVIKDMERYGIYVNY